MVYNKFNAYIYIYMKRGSYHNTQLLRVYDRKVGVSCMVAKHSEPDYIVHTGVATCFMLFIYLYVY